MVPDDSSIWLYSATRYTSCFTDSQGTKENTQKVKNRLRGKQKILARKLSREPGISTTSVRQILKIDLGLEAYKKIIQSSFSDDQKIKWKQFAN